MGKFGTLRTTRFSAFEAVFASLLMFTHVLVAQTAQVYMNAACANEIRQQTSPSLWASTSDRRSGGHLYIDHTVETVDGDVQQIVSVDGHPPAGTDKAKNDKMLQGLLTSARLRQEKHKSNLTEEKDAVSLLRALPHMFVLQDEGGKDGIETLSFKPDPAYQPQSYEQRAIHEMEGEIYVAKDGMRLVGIDATVSQAVQFGFGLLGTLEQGGTFTLRRAQVAPGVWKTQHTKVDLAGRIALFKNLSKQEEETKSVWRQLPPDTTVLQALAILGVHEE